MTLKQTIVQYSIQNADIHNEKAWQEGHTVAAAALDLTAVLRWL